MINVYDFDVSICCTTYNQKKYIQQTINSFLDQREGNNLKIEIIIHDDCSTDGTTEILKKFQEENDDIVLILQQENQFSLGKKNIPVVVDKARGKYIAFCEGDDFWIDKNKIKKQYDYMETHPDCTLCVHGAQYVNRDGEYLSDYICKNVSDKLSLIEVVEKGGNYIPTLSWFFRKEDGLLLPDVYKKCPVGDYPLQIFLSEKGYCFYMSDIMGAYRVNSLGSMTDYLYRNTEAQLKLMNSIINMFEEFNVFYNYKYSDLFEKMIIDYSFEKSYMMNDLAGILDGKGLKKYQSLSFKNKLKVQIKCRYPNVFNSLKKIFGNK